MATIRFLTTNSLRGALNELIPQFERSAGHKVDISYDPAKIMMERIRRGESADAAVLSQAAMDQLVAQGKVAAASRRPVASCGVGVAVVAGAARPDIGSVEAFKRALQDARAVAWTLEGVSGMHFSKLLEQWGMTRDMQTKAVQQPGGLIGHLAIERKADLAIQQIPELLAVPGLELIGPLPAEVQLTTVSHGGVFAESREPAAAQALIDFLRSPTAAVVFRAKGHQPQG